MMFPATQPVQLEPHQSLPPPADPAAMAATDLASEFASRWRKSHRQEQRVFLQCPDEKQFGLLLGGHPQMEGMEHHGTSWNG